MRTTLALLIGLASASGSASARGDDFPADLVHWVPAEAAPVFAGTGTETWDKRIRERGFVLRSGGSYHLWYTGYNDDLSPKRLLGHATSADGVRWVRDPANPLLTTSFVEDMCVVKRDGTYFMFAEGRGDIAHLLTSTDRIHWTERGPLDVRTVDGKPIPPGPYGTPTAWMEGGIWYLFYERYDSGIWLAKSVDCKTWVNVKDDPVIATGPAPYDKFAVAMNQVIRRDGYYYAFYHANATKPWKDWTSNVARSRDLITWEKYPGNPIVMNNQSSPVLVDGPAGVRLYTMHPEIRVLKPATR